MMTPLGHWRLLGVVCVTRQAFPSCKMYLCTPTMGESRWCTLVDRMLPLAGTCFPVGSFSAPESLESLPQLRLSSRPAISGFIIRSH